MIPLIAAFLLLNGAFNCTNVTQMNYLVDSLVVNQTYHLGSNDCRYFSYRLGNALAELNCTFKLVTGWNAPPRTYGRSWHRWVQTPSFQIESTPQSWGLGVISDPSIYDMRYSTSDNWSHVYG